QLLDERSKLHELLVQDEAKSALQGQQMTLQRQQTTLEAQAIRQQRDDVQKRLRDVQAQAPLLKQRFDNRARLEALGLLPKISDERLQAEQAYLENQKTLAELQARLTQLDSAVKQLDSQAKQAALQSLEASTARKNTMQELRSQIALLEVQLVAQGQIVSPYHGRILEITVHVGHVLQAGYRLGPLDVEDAASTLLGLIYFPI